MSDDKTNSSVEQYAREEPTQGGLSLNDDERQTQDSKLFANSAIDPRHRHSVIAAGWSKNLVGLEQGRLSDVVNRMSDGMDQLASGDTAKISDMLLAQAMSLDTMFTELTRRAGVNLGEYPEAAEKYLRLAFKAQANSRATLEALARMHQPREQIVKHVTVHEGGQAVVADQFHQHSHGGRNEKPEHQPHATRATGGSTTLPSPNPLGDAVPIPGDAERSVQDARRDIAGSAEG